MGEGLLRFREKINRKAEKYFKDRNEVSFEDFHNFVNYKMGTEFHEKFVEDFYNYFLGKREEKISKVRS